MNIKISEFKILEITLTRNNEEYRSLRKIGKFYIKFYIKISIRFLGEKELINKNKLCNHMLERH